MPAFGRNRLSQGISQSYEKLQIAANDSFNQEMDNIMQILKLDDAIKEKKK